MVQQLFLKEHYHQLSYCDQNSIQIWNVEAAKRISLPHQKVWEGTRLLVKQLYFLVLQVRRTRSIHQEVFKHTNTSSADLMTAVRDSTRDEVTYEEATHSILFDNEVLLKRLMIER